MAVRPRFSDGEAQELRRSSDFWFKKGDFVLIARNEVAYRIHGDVVGRKSKVFRDLLDLDDVPRPDFEHTLDGCPVVHITDSPDDFSTFLSLLHDGFEHLRRHVQEPRWSMVRVMILLGDKYDVPEIREEGLRQLRAWYSDDIDEWDKRDEAFFAHVTDHLSVASITRTLDEPRLHAAVLYYCCRLSPAQLVTGWPDTGCPPLCTDDLICALGYMKRMPEHLHALFSLVFEEFLIRKLIVCTECGPSRRDLLVRTAVGLYLTRRIAHNAYELLDISIWRTLSTALETLICGECVLLYQARLRDMRQIYLRLPGAQ